MLIPELESIRPLPEHLPQHAFGQGHLRLSARARLTTSLLSRRGGIYPSTMLGMVPLPIWQWGGC
jgi:hypothetical protein